MWVGEQANGLVGWLDGGLEAGGMDAGWQRLIGWSAVQLVGWLACLLGG